MTEDYKILSIYIVFGFLIILGYGRMIVNHSSKEKGDKVWSGGGKNIILDHVWLKRIYIFMILLSSIAGIYLIYYFTTTAKAGTDEILIYTGSVVFLVCSMVWAFWPFEYSKIVLGFVAIGAILILAGICENDQDPNDLKKIVALLASSILVFQSGFFDFVIWNGIYPFNK